MKQSSPRSTAAKRDSTGHGPGRADRFVKVKKDDLPPGEWVTLSVAEAQRLGVIRTSKVSAKRSSRAPPLNSALSKRTKDKAQGVPSVSEEAFAPGLKAKALLRGVEITQADLARSGGAYDLASVQTLLHGVSRQSVEARVRSGGLLAVPGPSNKRYYPVVQFRDDGTVVDGLSEVQAALPTKNAFAILNFLINPDDRLGGRKPIDLLKAGDVTSVVEAARRYAEAGA